MLSGDKDWSIRDISAGLGPISPGRVRVLDFGCGRGMDATYMNSERYDPHWYPTKPEGKFDIIFCTYVLNVVGSMGTWAVLDELDDLAEDGCCRYVTVRRDLVPGDVIRHDGYVQYYVPDTLMKEAGYQSAYHKKNTYEIYVKSDYGDY